MKQLTAIFILLSIAVLFSTCRRNQEDDEPVIAFGDPLKALNDNLILPSNAYQKFQSEFTEDNNLTVGTSSGTMPLDVDEGLTGSITFSAPDGNVAAAGMRFGDSGPINVIPISGGQGVTSGTMNVQFRIGAGTCSNLSKVCHDIKCYEFAITDDGRISRANIRDVALMCGNCDEPSCKDLIQPPCPTGGGGGGGSSCEGNFTSSVSGSVSGQCGCTSTSAAVIGDNWTMVSSNVGTSGSHSFTSDYYTGACTTCPALQLTSNSGADNYIAVSGSGSWSGNTFSFSASIKTINEVVTGTGSSRSISGSVNCIY